MARENYINVRLDNDIYNALTREATKDGEVNISSTVRAILRKHYGLVKKTAAKRGAANGR